MSWKISGGPWPVTRKYDPISETDFYYCGNCGRDIGSPWRDLPEKCENRTCENG